jgi:hypothetical protein
MSDDDAAEKFLQASQTAQEAAGMWRLFTFIVVGSTVLWAVTYDASRRRRR